MSPSSPLSQELARLVADPAFQRLDLLQNQPNIFRAIGRTFTERWHSAFLGWLLDPAGSHGLGAFPLRRFLAAVSSEALAPDAPAGQLCSSEELAEVVLLAPLEQAEVLPNERSQQEHSFAGGRFDVWIEVAAAEGGDAAPAWPGFLCIVEMKIDAALAEGQAGKYADHLQERIAEQPGGRAACVLLCRGADLADSSAETTGDDRWFCMDFQQLHDEVLVPVAAHPSLSARMRPLVEHYVLNLRDNTSSKGPLAVTMEERELATQLLERYQEVFKKLDAILGEEEAYPGDLAGQAGPEPVELKLVVGDRLCSGDKVPDFLRSVLDFVFASDRRDEVSLPVKSGSRRFLLAIEPKHPTGKDFFSPREYTLPGGETAYFEANISRKSALALARKWLEQLGFDVGG